MNQRKDILDRKNDILKWISDNKTKEYICKELSCKTTTLNTYLEKMGIKYNGNRESGNHHKKKTIPIEKFLNNEKTITSYKLKNRLLKDGIKEHVCEGCGLSEWQGNLIPLELHHIDGNHFNNNLLNLQLLCPNCHALTDNYRGKGIKLYKEKHATKRTHEYSKKKKLNKQNYCIDCGKQISINAKRCKSCASIQHNKSKKRPQREILKSDIRNNSFLRLSKKYGVSDNAIRKWCTYYKLPFKRKDIRHFTDEEWEKI